MDESQKIGSSEIDEMCVSLEDKIERLRALSKSLEMNISPVLREDNTKNLEAGAVPTDVGHSSLYYRLLKSAENVEDINILLSSLNNRLEI